LNVNGSADAGHQAAESDQTLMALLAATMHDDAAPVPTFLADYTVYRRAKSSNR
jgi:hypothetical protein